MNGNILEIQHFSVHDGPGIRTTIFFKGCQLHCLWCHNPESIRMSLGELSFVPGKCVHCGSCFQKCPVGAHMIENEIHKIDRNRCKRCGICAENCIGGALEISGKQVAAEQIIAEVSRDMPYYRESGGGVTLSGGEPMMQKEFVKELLRLCAEKNIHAVLETNLCYPYEWLDGIREHVDIFFADWKESDSERHRAYTGSGNEMIYHNIKRLCEDGCEVLLRCPIIPGYNDRLDHFKRISEITKEFPQLIGAELLPYHRLGLGKIEKYGLAGIIEYVEAEEPTKEIVDGWIDLCRRYGGRIINEKG